MFAICNAQLPASQQIDKLYSEAVSIEKLLSITLQGVEDRVNKCVNEGMEQAINEIVQAGQLQSLKQSIPESNSPLSLKIKDLDGKIKKYQYLLEDQTLSKDKYIYCQQMIQKFEAMKQQLLNASPSTESSQDSNLTEETNQALIAQYDAKIKVFESYIADPTLPKDKYTYCQQMIQKLEDMKQQLLNPSPSPKHQAQHQSSEDSDLTQEQIKALISQYNADIKRFESYIADPTLPQDKYMLSQATISRLEQKIAALQQKLIQGTTETQVPQSPTGTLSTEAMLAKIDASIQRYESLMADETIQKDEYTFYARIINSLQEQKIEILNKQAPQGRRLQALQPASILSEKQTFDFKMKLTELRKKCRTTSTSGAYLEINSSLKDIVDRYMQIKKLAQFENDKRKVTDRSLRMVALIQKVNELFSQYPKYD